MSAEGLRVALQDGVRILTLAHPPRNALTPDLRASLRTELCDLDPICQGIVITAEGPAFSSDLPIGPDPSAPSLASLCLAVAECRVPVVVVLQGLVTGPGAELAVAARARLADPSLRIAFADVSLGLCPGAGASQRLPRLIGAKAALQVLLSGRAVPASEALSLGLIDGITETAPLAAAVRLARALAVGNLLERTAPDPVEWQSAVATARRDHARKLPADRRIVDCVEAALLLPVESGLAFEAAARADLEETSEASGLQAAALAERRAQAVPAALTRPQPLPVERIGLVGASPDLARMAVAALSRDLEVVWLFETEAERQSGLAAIGAGIGEGQRVGRLTPARARDMERRLRTGDGPDLLAGSTLVLHDRPSTVTTRAWAEPGAAHVVLGGAPGEIGLGLALGGRVCELTLPPESDRTAQATALAGLRRIGLLPVIIGARPVVGARLVDAGRTAFAWMVSRGVPRRVVTAALDGFGMRLADPVSAEAPAILRAMSATEVLNRWLAALANEGARLLDEGLVRRPSDIDYLMVAGLGFPRWRGGPMHQADQRGLMVLRHDLRAWGAEARLWSPASLIDRLIGEGKTFDDLNGTRP
jgi:3-hydroxyacyl-CoA dehydrogenase